MRTPYSTPTSNIDILEYYFNIEDIKKPLFTPLVFYNCKTEGFIQYDKNFYKRKHITYSQLLNGFENNDVCLRKYIIKNLKYASCCGTIFRYEEGEDTIHRWFPIVIACFDESTNFDVQHIYNLKFVVSNQELNNPVNKLLRPKIMKLLNSYGDKHEVIFTNDLERWCFNRVEKLQFKSIKEQTQFFNKLIEQV